MAKTESNRAKNEKVGQVVSTKMQKTIVVEVTRRVPHPVYKRIVTKRKKFYAHDEESDGQVGDVVRIVECRPLSRLKRWQLAEVVRRAAQVGVEPENLGARSKDHRPVGKQRKASKRTGERHDRNANNPGGGRQQRRPQAAVHPAARRRPGAARRLGRRGHGQREGSRAGFGDQEGQSGALRDRPDAQGNAAARTAPTSGSIPTPPC